MKSLLYSLTVVLLLSFSSCGYESPKFKALKAKNDSIMLVQETLKRDVKEYLSVIKHLDSSIDRVKNAEAEYVQQIKTKLNARENSLVNDNIAKLNAYIKENAEKTEKVQKQLKQSNARRNQFEAKARALTAQLKEAKEQLATLETEVQEKDSTLAELNENLVALTAELDGVKSELATQNALIEGYEKTLFTAFYIAAPKAELKKAKVLRTKAFCKSFIFEEDFDSSVLTPVDCRENQTIVLAKSVSGKVLSAHPKASYSIEKTENNEKVIKILDAAEFWSITKYLVIR